MNADDSDARDHRIPRLDGLNHVALEVRDLASAVRFYRDVVGLEEMPTPAGAAGQGIRWLRFPDGRMLHLIEGKEARPQGRAHFALAVPDPGAWREYLAGRGAEAIEPTISLYGADRFFVRDPSGNLFELVRWIKSP